jgi:predicted nucleic acid-binding protein
MKGIADTGFVVAAGNRHDSHHEWAVGLAQEIKEPLFTCEAVLAQAAFHLESSEYALSLIERGLLEVGFDLSQNQQLQELGRRHADLKPDLADLCLIRMSELYPCYTIITTDESDFRVYRRNKREAIPLICPPRSH